jgi:microcystin-dependent protein
VWDSATEYIANKSYVLGSNGDIYRAVADSVGVNPVGDTSNKWFRVLDNYYLKGEIDSFIAATVMPSGAIIDFAMNSAPSGYLVCNGSAVSRTAFAALFARIGTLYGTGDGSTTFNLPNFQGKFRRGHNPTASGWDAGRVFGSEQNDELRAHTHKYGGQSGGTSIGFSVSDSDNAQDLVTTSTGGAETRPVNIAVLTCIKV